MRKVQLREAKAKLSSLIDEAVGGAPSLITRHGKEEAVLLSVEDFRRLSSVPSFGRLLMSAPIEECDIEHIPGGLRETSF